MSCNKSDEPLVVYRFLGNMISISMIMTKLYHFKAEMKFQSNQGIMSFDK